MSEPAPIRIGIVGYGKIAQDQHVPVIRAHPSFLLAAVASARGATLVDVPCNVRTLAEMLSGDAVDAVAICTPPRARYGLARAALLAGRHVLLEKPPAATLGEVDELARIARENGRTLFATWHSRFAPAVEAARRELAGQTISRMRIVWKEDVRRWHPGQAWIWQAGGFGVFDPGINALSIATHILPRPIVVRDATLKVPSNRDAPIAASVVFADADGEEADLTAEFDWRQTGPQTWDIEITTSAGRIVLLANGGSELAIDGRLAARGEPAEYQGIYDAFAELIRSGRSDVDVSPLRLVADCCLVGRRVEVDGFVDDGVDELTPR